MSVHQLTSQNFSLINTGQTKNLNINLRGAVLCFFKMDSCPGCNSFNPIFRQLSLEEVNINYAIVNLTTSRDVVTMSRQTTTPITAVPFLLLFINGNPHAKYNGQKTVTALKSFINKALQHAPRISDNSQTFMPHANNNKNQGNAPGYNQAGHQAGFQPSDIVNQSNFKKNINPQNKYNGMNNEVEEEEEDRLSIPDQITPYNVPWEIHYKKLAL
jgi:thioredoxin-like negative regulator of GroEL